MTGGAHILKQCGNGQDNDAIVAVTYIFGEALNSVFLAAAFGLVIKTAKLLAGRNAQHCKRF